MIKKNLYNPLEVEYKKIEECPLAVSKYTFFQILYVIRGKGEVVINNNISTYTTGDFLLFIPDDRHTLKVPEVSEFLLIRFNENFLKKDLSKQNEYLKTLLYYAPYLMGSISLEESDKYLVQKIISFILEEIKITNKNYSTDLIIHFVNALITVIARNIVLNVPEINKNPNINLKTQEIIYYLQKNIHCPQKLKAITISKEFGISRSYLSNYFKNETGETIQQYTAQYKLKLIEHRLKLSDNRIKEIVAEFGFSDESHMNKFFKKYRGISLTRFRNTK